MKMPAIDCPEFKIGVPGSTLYLLNDLGIPYPWDWLFDEFGVRYVRGDLSQRGDGFPSAAWIWKAGISREAYTLLIGMGGGGFNAGSSAVQIRTRTNQLGANMWMNFLAHMYLPQLTGQEGSPAEQWVGAVNNLTIKFAGLIAF